MEPRRPESKKWTPLPQDLLQEVIRALKSHFKKPVEQGDFFTDGRIYPSELLFSVGYLEKGKLRQVNFESSLDYDKKRVLDEIHLCVDASVAMLHTYFEEEETDFPRSWKEVVFNNRQIHLRMTTINTILERAADEILGETDHGLIRGEDDPELDDQ